MTPRPIHWVLAICLSLAIHTFAAVMMQPEEPDIKLAGATPVAATILGDAFSDSLAAGAPSDAIEAAASEPSETEVVQAAETSVVISVENEPIEPSEANAATSEPLNLDGGTIASALRAIEPVAAEANAATQMPIESILPSNAEVAISQSLGQDIEAADVTPNALEPVKADPSDFTSTSNTVSGVAPIPIPTPRPEHTSSRNNNKTVEKHKVQRKRNEPAKRKTETRRKRTDTSGAGNSGRSETESRRGSSTRETAGRSQSSGNAAVSNYPGKVVRKLRRAIRYPAEARRKRLRGEALVTFVVSRNGSARSIRVVRSSGSAILDKAALATVRRAAPFPPIPDNRSRWKFTVPIAFNR